MTDVAIAHGVLPETVISQSETAVVLQATIPEQCDYFDGHFPCMKLLPAVAQVDLVSLYAAHYFGAARSIQQAKRFKFSEKIFPGATVVFTLSYTAESKMVAFKLTDAQSGAAYSSGSFVTFG